MYTTVHIDQHLKKVLLLLFNHKVLLKYEFLNEVFQDGACVFGMPSAAPLLCVWMSLWFLKCVALSIYDQQSLLDIRASFMDSFKPGLWNVFLIKPMGTL